MFKKLVMIGLLGICVASLRTEAIAMVCLAKLGGTCVQWSGSVECDIVADQVGSVSNHPKVDCDSNHPTTGIMACSNGGKKANLSPGIQLVFVDLSGSTEFDSSATTPILKGDIKNGEANVVAIASLSSTQLAQLDQFCPNPQNWDAVGFVPCETDVHIALRNDSGTLDEVTYHCSLPQCDTLGIVGFDNTGKFHFERRQYECSQVL